LLASEFATRGKNPAGAHEKERWRGTMERKTLCRENLTSTDKQSGPLLPYKRGGEGGRRGEGGGSGRGGRKVEITKRKR